MFIVKTLIEPLQLAVSPFSSIPNTEQVAGNASFLCIVKDTSRESLESLFLTVTGSGENIVVKDKFLLEKKGLQHQEFQ